MYELDLQSNSYQRAKADIGEGFGDEVEPMAQPRSDLQRYVVQVNARATLLMPFLAASIRARRLAKQKMSVVFEAVSAHLARASLYSEAISRDHVFRRCAAYRRMAALRVIQPMCLENSLGGLFFLEKPYPGLSFCVGVRASPFLAHAWLELDGVVLNDSWRRVEDYEEICVVK